MPSTMLLVQSGGIGLDNVDKIGVDEKRLCECGCGNLPKDGKRLIQYHRKRKHDPFDVIRICPNPSGNSRCIGELIYTTNKEKRKAELVNSVCASCRSLGRQTWLGKKHSVETRIKMGESQLTRKTPVKKSKGTTEEFMRSCPNPANNDGCLKLIFYTSVRERKIADKNDNVCKHCATIGLKMSAEVRARISDTRKEYYKTHIHHNLGIPLSDEAKLRISKTLKDSGAFKGKNNPMYGKSGPLAPAWGRKHTKEELDKMSNSQIGRKPAIGSGYGIGGWYNGLHYRSSCELRFLMSNDGEGWVSAEKKKFRVFYVDFEGKRRGYYPDFFNSDGNRIREIKPVGWEKFQLASKLKVEAGKKWYGEHGFDYRVIEIEHIPENEVFEMRKCGRIELNRRWEKKYQNWSNK